MTARRKLFFGLFTLVILLGGAEGLCRLLYTPVEEDPIVPRRRTQPTVEAFLEQVRVLASRPRVSEFPGVVLTRVPDGTPGAMHDAGMKSSILPYAPADIPSDGRKVLLFGGSAAFGFNLPYEQTLAHHLQGELNRDRPGDPIQVLNMAGLGVELNAVVYKVRQAVDGMRRAPEAVIINSGNNEFLDFLPRVGIRPWEALRLYWLAEEVFRTRRWLGPPRGLEPRRLFEMSFQPLAAAEMAPHLWQPGFFLDDASFWPRARQIYLDNYRLRLRDITAWLRQRGVTVVLVAPPVNLYFFPGNAQKQPVSSQPLGKSAYRALARELYALLDSTPGLGDEAALSAFVKRVPDGAIQLFALAQLLDHRGRHADAHRLFEQSRDQMMGVLSSLPAMNRLVLGLGAPGVLPVDTRALYEPGRPLLDQARASFIDSCHPSSEGNQRLARLIARVLTPALLRPPPAKHN